MGRNWAFDHAGNVAIAVVAGAVGYAFSQRAVFLLVPIFSMLAGIGRLLKMSRGWTAFGLLLLSRSFLKSTICLPASLDAGNSPMPPAPRRRSAANDNTGGLCIAVYKMERAVVALHTSLALRVRFAEIPIRGEQYPRSDAAEAEHCRFCS